MSFLLENGEPRNPNAPLQGTVCKAADFVFKDGVFYATFEGHIHPRKSAEELFQYLNYKSPLPVITDTGRTWTAPIGNHTTYKPDFYSAQLLHYGLKPLKTKGPAKKRLLEAFGGSDGRTLDVPMSILQLEEAMRAWWQRSNSGMKAETKVETGILMQSRDSPALLLFHNLPSSSVMPLQAIPEPRTKQTAVKSSNTLQAGAPRPPLWTRPKVKQTARKTTGMPTYLRTSPKSVGSRESSPPRYETKQTARMGGGRLASIIARERVKELRKTQAVPTMTSADMRKAIKSLKADQARQVLAALVGKLPLRQKDLAKEISLAVANPASSKSKAVDPSEMTGLYDIEAPCIEGEDYGLSFTFEVYSSSTSSHFWASFDFGAVSGVMRSVYPAPSSFDTEVYFEWRGRDSSENIMTFDPDNRAVITFLPGGLLEGKMAAGCHGTFKLYGSIQVRRHFGVVVTRKSEDEQRKEVRSWKDEWRGLNAHNYDIECTERWGKSKWVRTTRDEKAFESDTTAGKRKRPWKIDVEKFMGDPDTDFEKWDDEDDDDLEDDDEW